MGENNVVNYRALYEQSVCMMAYNIMKDISALLSAHETIKFEGDNKFKFDGKNVTGICLQKQGVYIMYGTKKFEVSEDNKTFNEFSKEPYNFIKLYESVTKTLNLK